MPEAPPVIRATAPSTAVPAAYDALLRGSQTLLHAGGEADYRQAVALFDATTRFYEVIFTAAGQQIAWEIVQRLNGRISRLRALTLATSDRHVSGPVRMARICAAIQANDPAGAAAAVRDHLTEAAQIAQRLLQTEGNP